MFKKDDYIVLLGEEFNTAFPTNYCYQQREDFRFLRPYLDKRGSFQNGFDVYDFKRENKGSWRFATQQEIDKYEELGKPFDVTKQNYEPNYEIY